MTTADTTAGSLDPQHRRLDKELVLLLMLLLLLLLLLLCSGCCTEGPRTFVSCRTGSRDLWHWLDWCLKKRRKKTF